MQKWMIVYVLPLEVWMDIFCFPWISRAKFGQLVDKISNFKFAEHAQFYLHEWGKRTLSTIAIDEEDGLCRYGGNKPICLDVPRTPLPENIKSISYIQISHFDAKTMDLLDQIRPLLNADVNLELSTATVGDVENLRTIWTGLAPLLDGIRTMHCFCEFALRRGFLREHLDKIRVLKVTISVSLTEIQQESANIIMNWLTTPGQDNPNNGPKLCEASLLSDHGFAEEISIAIRQQFLVATTPRTFAMNVSGGHYVWQHQVAEFHLANGIGEELHCVWAENGHRGRIFQITRHQANGGMELQEWVRNTKAKRLGCVHILYPSIGSLDSAQVDVPSVDMVEQAEQQPCSSKDL